MISNLRESLSSEYRIVESKLSYFLEPLLFSEMKICYPEEVGNLLLVILGTCTRLSKFENLNEFKVASLQSSFLLLLWMLTKILRSCFSIITEF
jgi:hypothetical protein